MTQPPVSGPSVIVRDARELPRLGSAREVFLDVETTSGDDRRYGNLPYSGDRIAGISVTVDDEPTVWYVPLRHRATGTLFHDAPVNLDVANVRAWLNPVLASCGELTNHNVTFDAHMLSVDGFTVPQRLTDTLTLAKIVDQQSKLSGYGLDDLAKDWLGADMSPLVEFEREKASLKTKDYGGLPVDSTGRYACWDVRNTRALRREIEKRRYEGDGFVWDIEKRYTRCLFDAEKAGVRVDTNTLDEERLVSEREVDQASDSAAREFHLHDLNSTDKIVSGLLPFLRALDVSPVYTDTGAVCTDEDSLLLYRDAATNGNDGRERSIGSLLVRLINLILTHREHSQFLELYVNGWRSLIGSDGRLHPRYNQLVRTGRSSCSEPNVQQLNTRAKRCIIPGEGRSFVRWDYSQVEYRFIGAISGDPEIVRAYNDDPNTDFHELVASLFGITRRPAKVVNFGVCFGMGAELLRAQLARALGGSYAGDEADRVLREYRQRFARVFEVSRIANRLAKQRGYIKTMYGRRRALRGAVYNDAGEQVSASQTHKAFPTAVQGSAADLFKERVVEVCESGALTNGTTLNLLVHDEIVFEIDGTDAPAPAWADPIADSLVRPSIPLRVPIRVASGHASTHWADASD